MCLSVVMQLDNGRLRYRIELNGWRHVIRQTCNKVNDKRVNAYERQRDKRKRKENLEQ